MLPLLLCSNSCQQNTPANTSVVWEEFVPLFERQQRLRCKLDSLQEQAELLWDGVVEHLAEELPPNLPADERRNILAVRNYGLIRMFMVYDSLPPDLREKVELAGRQDIVIAVAMKATNTEAEAIAHTLDSNLVMRQKELGKADYLELLSRFTNSQKESVPCN